MAAGYHVFGAAQLLTSTGVSGAYEEVGFTRDGVRISQMPKFRNIMTDINGPDVEGERQQTLEKYRISGRFVVYDATVLAKLAARNDNSSPVEGTTGTAGLLQGTGGYTFKIGITTASSQTSEAPYYFAWVTLVEPKDVTIGTINMEYDLVFDTFPFAAGSAVTSKGVVQMSRSLI